MTDIPLNQPDKETLLDRLSLFYVAAKLNVNLDREGRGICPFHADTDPSFYLWDGDDGRQRWWCQPCGFGGDIFDLIRRVQQVTFPAALQIAQEFLDGLPPGYEPPARALQANRPNPEDWWLDVAAAKERAEGQPGILAALTGLAPIEDPRQCQAWDTYLRGTWGWGVSSTGQIYMPHWDNGALVGCKVRAADGARQSLPGSRYEMLYGSWLGRRHQDTILTEGETDAVYAGWAAAEARIPIDVFALPSGAQQDIDPRWLNFLHGTRVLYLVFDPDKYGVEATRRWIDALNTDGRFQDVRVCSLPLGRDLRDARPALDRLLAAAQRPLQEPDNFFIQPGGYIRSDRNGIMRQIADWTLEPIAQLAGEGDAGFKVELRSRGLTEPATIRIADLSTVTSLKRWANSYGHIFTGNDGDVQAIAKSVQARGVITPEVFQSARVGVHSPPAAYSFAGPTVLFPDGYLGQLPFQYTPNGKVAANVSGRVLLPLREAGLFDWAWLRAFLALSSPDVMQPILAWIVAAARRNEVRQFPLLFLGGSSGVGKSSLARLALRLAGSNIEVDLGGTTKFVLTTTLASTTSIPIFIDEWTKLSGHDIRLAFKGSIPIIYTGGLAERGQADLSTVPYWMTSPIIVAGEDSFVLAREQERMIPVTPTRRSQNPTAYASILDKPLERFGAQLYTWLASQPPLPDFPPQEGTRPEYNASVLVTGWRTLQAFLNHAAAYSEDVPDIPDMPDLSCFEREHESEDENMYLVALKEGRPLADSHGLPFVWNDPDGEGTWVRTQALLGELQRRQIDLELPGGSRAMLNYFRETYPVEDGQPLIPAPFNKRVRAHIIRGLLLEEEADVEDSGTVV